jgi:hypothetical protein
MPTDSQQKKLNSFEIVVESLQEGEQTHPMQAMLAGAIAQLTHENVKPKQIGNTLFYTISGDGNSAYLSSYNADTKKRFIENAREMFVYCQKKLKLKRLVVDADTPEEVQVFNSIMQNLSIKNMHSVTMKNKDGRTQFVLTLGG